MLSLRIRQITKNTKGGGLQLFGVTFKCFLQKMKKSVHANARSGKEYIAAGAYGTGNLKHHLELCPRKFEAPLSIPVSTVADIGKRSRRRRKMKLTKKSSLRLFD